MLSKELSVQGVYKLGEWGVELCLKLFQMVGYEIMIMI